MARSKYGRINWRRRRKIDPFDENPSWRIDYKNPELLKLFLTTTGKMLPARITGLSAKNQRRLRQAILRSRQIALLPHTTHKS
ncbi:30S ribosomal protein S18 [Bradymonas sediminis]|jgi:small subunit ribosomal protein S18|uniref:Small ribosomal subunit protein bS18 n=1 Tax=Bradymonas sediminis TaxID=1548548 RepID=A0A2Z4FQS5_9DELT|nr:30S ribosomal protein S18 [Bradymonas sediminis]AWV91310.1 30S ribosomal protein S18 [Bradymonas sediminis]TDP73888.1 SSU ribosomal protein S18P [Bradymonas sediminis]